MLLLLIAKSAWRTLLAHVPEKWTPVFRKEHAPLKKEVERIRFHSNGMCTSSGRCQSTSTMRRVRRSRGYAPFVASIQAARPNDLAQAVSGKASFLLDDAYKTAQMQMPPV